MNIVLMLNAGFPYGQAISSRMRHFAALFCDCGYHVHVIAPERKNAGECQKLLQNGCTIQYVNAPSNVWTLAGFGTAKPYMAALREYIAQNPVDAIISNSMAFVASKILRFAKKHHIPYIIEQCEWYDPSSFKFGKWNPHYREHVRLLTKKNRYCDGVIAISRYLAEHYAKQGARVVRIPTILDVQATEYALEHDRDVLKIAFAGSLGNGKENIAPILEAIGKLGDAANGLHFDLYGASNSQVLANIGNDEILFEKVRPFFTAHGRIPQQEVEAKVREADYTIFIRPDRRSSHAGFPTKLAESLAVGTPVISNATGDIGQYLETGKNGFLLDEGTADALEPVLRQILAMDSTQRKALRQNTRNTAETSFDYRVYKKQMEELLNSTR